MDKKQDTAAAYTRLAAPLDGDYAAYFHEVIQPEAGRFLHAMPSGGRILDAGAGTGAAAEYFAGLGYDVLAVDLSQGMVDQCRAKGITAELMDLEHLELPDSSFDGIWCHTSLIHLEDKLHIPPVLDQFARILRPQRPLFVALRKGEKDGWETYHGEPGTDRWFLYFKEREFPALVPMPFTLQEERVTSFAGREFLNYHLLRC